MPKGDSIEYILEADAEGRVYFRKVASVPAGPAST
jgi:hypothetical protein